MKKVGKSATARLRSPAPALLGPEKQALHHRRTRQAHAAEIAEDYVEVIADLIDAGGEARAVDIAKRLGVTHVTVTKTIARLQKGGLVSTRPYRSIFLTDAGRRLAESSRQRHQTVTRFLTAIGVSEPVAHSDAEGIEHHVSDETLRAMRAFVSTRSR
ncbi:MAG TPA: manganese-binding transcriptional regulator MntR [Phycisphaerae bacterium]|nr:manganese-binding transcriptional regulator MntR [Phycisphaerae bacterium]